MEKSNILRITAITFAFGLLAGPASAAINGAIFTTTADGQVVNGNNYAVKSDVYLMGGPTGAPCEAGKIDNGNYYFQVTSPSGASLLSTDAITDRGFSMLDGLIVGYSGPHGHSVGPCGSDTVQLIPFSNTPNEGGVYKVWVTHQEDYAPGSGRFGFVPGNTKTDNFRIKPQIVSYKGKINAYKFYDKNANGVWDGDEVPLRNWLMTLMPPDPGTSKLTDSNGRAQFGGLLPDTYSVTEGIFGGTWVHSGSSVDGVLTPNSPENPITNIMLHAGETINVEFGNYCTCASRGKTLGFWSNRNGQTKLNDVDTQEAYATNMTREFGILNALNLRNENGDDFDLDPAASDADNYAALRAWLLAGNATNMAYMLSVQLATMQLNVEAGFVKPDNFYIPSGGTIAELMTDANDALADGYTPDGDPNRALQEELKNYLDQLNNNATVVQAKPCPYKFYLPTY
ncbi:MAG TPA: hypothetical protein VIP76_05595 [Luteimonas sp.]